MFVVGLVNLSLLLKILSLCCVDLIDEIRKWNEMGGEWDKVGGELCEVGREWC